MASALRAFSKCKREGVGREWANGRNGEWGEAAHDRWGEKLGVPRILNSIYRLSVPVLSRAVDVDYRLIWVASFRRFALSPSRSFEALA
jgi:hypothetical protein